MMKKGKYFKSTFEIYSSQAPKYLDEWRNCDVRNLTLSHKVDWISLINIFNIDFVRLVFALSCIAVKNTFTLRVTLA